MMLRKINLQFILSFALLSLLAISPTLAYADDDEVEVIENLGWIAVEQELLQMCLLSR